MNLFNKDKINIMINDTVIRYLVSTNKNTVISKDYGEIDLDLGIVEDGKVIDQSKLTAVLKKLVKDKKWKNKQVAFCVPDAFVTMREESVPKQLLKDEVRKYIELELESSIRLPFKNPVIDFEIISEEEKTNKILLFAYPKERLTAYTAIFEQVNVKLVLADLSFLSIYRSYYTLDHASKDEHLLMVQWCKNDLILTVFNQQKPLFNRHTHFTIPSNIRMLNEEAQVDWSLDADSLQDFLDEQMLIIERFMDFYQYSIMAGEAQVSDLLLVADFPNPSLIKDMLSSRFNLSIKTLKLPDEIPQQYATLYGLSIRD